MKIILIIYFSFLNIFFSISFVYEPKTIINYFNSFIINENTLQYIIDSLSKTFDDAYAFNEIYKSPPKTKFSNNYFKKLNVQDIFKEIKVKNKTAYGFYQDLKKAL